MNRDVDRLARRIDHLTRAAARIRAQLADLHTLAYEAGSAGLDGTNNRPAFESRPPPGANRNHPNIGRPTSGPISRRDQAHHLWDRTEHELARCEDILVGLERAVTGWFMVSAAAEPSRGSLIAAGEHARLLANQRARRAAGDYTPTPIIDQPTHPGAQR